MNDNANPIVDLSFEFALQIISYIEVLEQNRKFVVAKQLLRSGTSIGANIRESQNAESRLDFIHKLKIASKEAEDTEYWLMLCQKSASYPNHIKLLDNLNAIQRMLGKIISTSKKNLKK